MLKAESKMNPDIKIGINETGQLGYLIDSKWHWMCIDRTVKLITEATKRIEIGQPLEARRCNGCGAGIMEKELPSGYRALEWACTCKGPSLTDDTWRPIQSKTSILVG